MKNLVEANKGKVILVLDIGTSFVKIGLFDTNANPIEDYQVKFEHWMTIKSDGTYIFNPIESAELIERGLDELLKRSNKYEIIAVSTDTMASTILGLDDNNNPITDVYTYADTRSHKELVQLKSIVNQKKVYDETGCPMHTSYIPSRILWLRKNNVEKFKTVKLWTDFSNYLLRRWMKNKDIPLSFSVASWTGMFDRKKLNWNESILRSIELDVNCLPKLNSFDFYVSGLNDKYLKKFYYNFMVSEAGHYKLFMDLAKIYNSEQYVKDRWNEFLDFEKDILNDYKYHTPSHTKNLEILKF